MLDYLVAVVVVVFVFYWFFVCVFLCVLLSADLFLGPKITMYYWVPVFSKLTVLKRSGIPSEWQKIFDPDQVRFSIV